MALISDFGSNYIFPTDSHEILPSILGENVATEMWNQECFPFYGNGASNLIPLEIDNMSSVFATTSFFQRLGIPAMDMAEPALPEFNMGLHYNAGIQSFGAEFQPEPYEFADIKCNRFSSDFCPVYGCRDVWGIQGNSLPTIEEPNTKVGRYSAEERKDRILKYLKKRNQRNFNKTIKYACRKTLADRRIRVRGRFARNNERGKESQTLKNDNNHQEDEEEAYYDDGAQIKQNGEEWLQEAVTSLMYLPIFDG